MEPFTVKFSRKASCILVICAPLFLFGGLFIFMKLSDMGADGAPLVLRVIQGVGGALFTGAGLLLFGFGLKNFIWPPVLFTACAEGLVIHLTRRTNGLRRLTVPWPEIGAIEKKEVCKPGQTRGVICLSFRLRNARVFRGSADVDKVLARNAYYDEKDEIHFSCFHFNPAADVCEKRFKEFLDLYGAGEDAGSGPALPHGGHWADAVQRIMAPVIFGVLFVAFLAAGVGSIGAGAWFLYRGNATRAWPHTQGLVLSSQVRQTDDKDDPGYFAEIRYEYSVKGKKYKSHKILFVEEVYGDRATAQKLVTRYAAHRQARVYYNARRPSESVLEPGANNSFIAFIVFGACALGVCVLLYVKRPRRAAGG